MPIQIGNLHGPAEMAQELDKNGTTGTVRELYMLAAELAKRTSEYNMTVQDDKKCFGLVLLAQEFYNGEPKPGVVVECVNGSTKSLATQFAITAGSNEGFDKAMTVAVKAKMMADLLSKGS